MSLSLSLPVCPIYLWTSESLHIVSDWQSTELGEEQHLVFMCPALQGVRDRYNVLFGDNAAKLNFSMRQHDNYAVAQCIGECMDAQVILALRVRLQISPRRPEVM